VRAVWRYLRVVLILVLEMALVGAAATFAPRILDLGHVPKGTVRAVVGPVLSAIAALATYGLLVKFVERRPVTELGARRAGPELAAGLALGAALFTVTIGLIALGGGYRVTGVHSATVLVPPLGMAIVSGVVEETMVRGVLFRLLEDLVGSWGALLVSAALFGLGHIGNPNATWFSALAIAVEAGTLLGAAYMATRRLWFAIGVHAAWNYTQGGVFGVAVSGHDFAGWLASEPRGPTWLSGGSFGAEASVVAIVVCGTAALLVLRYALRKGPAMAPAWSASRRERAAAA
jgi:membrane protease YdiL (CAAX protease family)